MSEELTEGVTANHGDVTLTVTEAPTTEKKEAIVQALMDTVSQVAYHGDLGEYTHDLIDATYDNLKAQGMNTQKAYVWQTFGQHVHVGVDTPNGSGESIVSNDEELLDIITELDSDELELFKELVDLDERETVVAQRALQYARRQRA